MASNTNIYTTGYDVQVVGDFLPHLNCGICTLILRDAMHGCINHVFCKACITKHIECGIKINGNILCPGGCNIVINPAKLEANKFADRMINSLTTRCLNANCTWQGDLLDLVQVHQINCGFLLQSCVNNGCNLKYLKKDILQHNEECLFKLLQCSYCQTDILRMDKEAHDVECLNEQVKCIYHDIGCKKELRRKDIHSHEQTNHAEHTRLIYQNITNSNNQIKDLKQENNTIKQENNAMKQQFVVMKGENITMKQETVAMKQEFVVLKEEFVVLKEENVVLKEENVLSRKKYEVEIHILKQDIAQIKQQQVQNNTVGFPVVQNKSSKLKNHNSKASDKIDVASNEIMLMESKEKVKNIDSLKLKLNMNRSLRGKVSLVNHDKVLIIKSNNSNIIDLYLNKGFTKCYEMNIFDWLLHNFGLMDNKSIIMELISNTKYHLYEYNFYGQSYMFVFPLDLHLIKDTEVVVPDMFKMTIIDNEIMVERCNQTIKNIFLHIEKYEIELKHQKKVNLQRLDRFRQEDFKFANGHAFLHLWL